MFTVIYRENDVDKWERLSTYEEVKYFLSTLDTEATCLEDVWIFPPDADNLAITGLCVV